jgi:hypothetical protein
MWPDDPQLRLLNINHRSTELRSEADANRAVHLHRADRGFSGLEIHVGRILILVGRTLGDDRSTPHPIHF